MKLMWRAWCDEPARRGLRSSFAISITIFGRSTFLAPQAILQDSCHLNLLCSGQDPVQREELSKPQCVHFEDWRPQHFHTGDLLWCFEPGLCCLHLIVFVLVMEWNKEDSIQVDLAGSERIKESGSEGVRLTEAQVLLGLVDPQYHPHFLSRQSTRVSQILARSSWRWLRR